MGNALTSFKGAAALTKDPEVSLRLVLEQVRILEKKGDKARAISLLAKSLERTPGTTQKKLLLNWMQRLDPKSFPAG